MKERFRLKIEKMALEGHGIGFNENKAVFVPYTAVGDELEAKLTRERKDMAFARAEQFFQRGEGVMDAPCKVFGIETPCGGCDWLHLDYATQLKYKSCLIRELFKSLAPELSIPETIPSADITHYRNKAFMPVGEVDGKMIHGIYARWTHHIVQHELCQLHPPLFDAIAGRALEIMSRAGVQAYDEVSHSGNLRHIGFRGSRDQSRVVLVLVTRSGKLPFSKVLVRQITEEFPQISGIVQNINRERGNVILGTEEKLLWGEPWLVEQLAGLSFRVSYNSFWQVNSSILEKIVAILKERVDPQATVFDLYSGLGALGLSLASHVKRVLCIEDNPKAVVDGEHNLLENGITNADYLRAKVEDVLPKLFESGGEKPDTVIMDPPRSGLRQPVLDALLAARIPRIFYLSCSPITLRRDLKFLLDSGLYEIKQIQPFDMFPHTWHVENLAEIALK
ncbi:MAG: 23S rRNA (uracil(1939)-C(5))-methyltransferase RlmD [Candidatus Cloacimonetes bacterium]|nr:23S rRNA (uracil(1939)-C(5))-methyltransferase RlmD [Candidatus Cloacimonadota bacterium]